VVTPAELNKINAVFWKVESAKFEERMKNPVFREGAWARVKSELRRFVPVRNQISFEEAIAEEEQTANKVEGQIKQRVVSDFGRRGGSVEKVDALQKFILSAVEKRPSIGVSELLDRIRDAAGLGPIVETDEDSISFVGARDRLREAPIAGLKDRLWRAKKKLKVEKLKSRLPVSAKVMSYSPRRLILKPRKERPS
jgi:hypothetical protein